MSDLPKPLTPHIVIQDAIHGRIWLTKVEADVIDTPEFQRLRNVGQLGLANFVFPTAGHSRFAHSIGAMHVIGWMLRQKRLASYFKERRDVIQILRLAALLHDVGHYPFSHLGENIWRAAALGAFDLYTGEGADRSVYDVAAEAERGAGGVSHEDLTRTLICETAIGEIINTALRDVEGHVAANLVAAIIDGSYPDVVCQNLVSSDLDCDRLDYLLRDSVSAGLSYGLVDLAYLIENIGVAKHSRLGEMLVVDKAHGARAVEHYILARYYHYAQFITHKTIAAAEVLLGVAILELIRHEKLPAADMIRSYAVDESFFGFNDALVVALLAEAIGSSWASPDLQEAARRLLARDLLKCAYDRVALEKEDEGRDRLDMILGRADRKQQFAVAAGVEPARFCYKRGEIPLVGLAAKVTPTEIVGDEKLILGRWAKAVKVAEPDGPPEPLVEQEGLLRDLSKRRWVTRRVYTRELVRAPKDSRPIADAVRNRLDEELT